MLIGLHGKKRSGKDTAAMLITQWANKNGIEARQDAFARRLKISASRALGFVGKDEDCDELCDLLKEDSLIKVSIGGNKAWEISGREYLQYYGTEAHREVFDVDFWVNTTLGSKFKHEDEIVIITDVRFANEAEAVHKLDGDVIEIVRGYDNSDTHASEQRIPKDLIDRSIKNNGTIEALRASLNDFLEGR